MDVVYLVRHPTNKNCCIWEHTLAEHKVIHGITISKENYLDIIFEITTDGWIIEERIVGGA